MAHPDEAEKRYFSSQLSLVNGKVVNSTDQTLLMFCSQQCYVKSFCYGKVLFSMQFSVVNGKFRKQFVFVMMQQT